MASYCLIEAIQGSIRGRFNWFNRGQLTASGKNSQQLFKREWPMGKQNKPKLFYHIFR